MSKSRLPIICAVVGFLAAQPTLGQEAPILPAAAAIPQLSVAENTDGPHQIVLTDSAAVSATVDSLASRAQPALSNTRPTAILEFSRKHQQRPIDGMTSGGVFSSASALPSEPFDLNVSGQRYELAAVSETLDRQNSSRHVTMRVLNAPQSYARFTIAGALMAGTLVTPQKTYRLLSIGRGQIAVYPLGGERGRARYRRVAERTDASVAALERRHVQLERLAEIQPRRAFLGDQGAHFSIEGGELGTLAVPTQDAVLSIVQDFGELTSPPADLHVRIDKVVRRSGSQVVLFQQMINDVPLYYRNELMIDAAGKIVGLTTNFVDPAWAADAPLITAAQAQEAAAGEIEHLTKAPVGDYELIRATDLSYKLEKPRQLLPYYTVSIRVLASGELYAFKVNAHSGAATLLIPPAAGFGWRICDGGAFPPYRPYVSCSESFRIQWDQTYGAERGCLIPSRPRDGGGGCRENQPLGAHYGMQAADEVLQQVEAYNPGACCDYVGGLDRSVDAIIWTSATDQIAVYWPPTGSILSGPYSALASIEVVWHELGHHILYTGSTKVPWNDVYGQPGKQFESAFVEAYGDLMSAVIAVNRPADTGLKNYGDPWIMADGSYAPGVSRRNLKDPAITSFYHMTNASTPHEAGRAIGKYFYNVQAAAQLSPLRMAEFLLVLGRHMEDFDNSGGLDLVDLKKAMLAAARPDEPALRNAIETQFDAMFNNVPLPSPGAPPPVGYPGIPIAPFPVTPVFTGCGVIEGARVTNWRVDWSPVTYATKYRSTGVSSVRTWVFESPATSVDVYTNVTGTVRVQSCNSANICSNPSVSVTVFHQSQCANF
jgi:hypothetical protein